MKNQKIVGNGRHRRSDRG